MHNLRFCNRSKVDEKIRTQKAVVSLVRIRDAYHSDESSSDASTGHKPGVILGNNAGTAVF